MISGEFFKLLILMLFPTELSLYNLSWKLYSKFLQQVVVLQDYCQIYYLKYFEDLRKIDIFLVALYYPKQGHCVKGYLWFSLLF